MKPHTFRFDYLESLSDTIKQMVKTALAEDLNLSASNIGADITAELIPVKHRVVASLISREDGILKALESAEKAVELNF